MTTKTPAASEKERIIPSIVSLLYRTRIGPPGQLRHDGTAVTHSVQFKSSQVRALVGSTSARGRQ